MAQDTNQVTRTPRTSASMGLSSPSDTEHLRQQIADTRAGMTDTLDAIQDRVSPRNIVNRATESVKESLREQTAARVDDMKNFARTAGQAAGYVAARTAGPRRRVMRMTRQNPRAAAAVVAGLAAFWMVMRAMRGRRRDDYLYDEADL